MMIMKTRTLVIAGLLAVTLALAVTGCSTGGTDDAVPTVTVYTAGRYQVGSTYKFCYWKNGTRVDLPLAEEGSYALAIAFSGSDVYVAGSYGSSPSTKACYWKNGTRVDLPGSQNNTAYAIALSGSDVYISGQYNNYKACYWKNGTIIIDLSYTTGSSNSNATAIALSGSGVYNAGYYLTGGDKTLCYWKNSVKTDVHTTSNNDDTPFSTTFSGSDVYIAGSYPYDDLFKGACYWKNGVRTDLPLPAGATSPKVIGITVLVGSNIP